MPRPLRAGWLLLLVSILASLARCEGAGPPRFADGYPRVERTGALTFVVSLKLDLPGAVDVVAAAEGDYPSWGAGTSLASVRKAAAEGGEIVDPPDASTPSPAFFRETVSLPTAGTEAWVTIRGAWNARHPERSGAHNAFVARPNTTYLVAAAPTDDAAGDDDVRAVEATTAATISSDASLRALGVGGVASLVPAFDASERDDASAATRVAEVDADAESVVVYASPNAGAVWRVTTRDVEMKIGRGEHGEPPGAHVSPPARVFYGTNRPFEVVVTAEDRVTTRRYRLAVFRPRSTEARLADLVLRSRDLNARFDPDVYAYSAAVPHDVRGVKVVPAVMDERAQAIRVNAVLVKNKAASEDVPLRVGNNVIAVEVIAQDPKYSKVYRVEIARAYPGTDVELGMLEVSSVSTLVTGRSMGIEVTKTVRTEHALTPRFDPPLSSPSAATGVDAYALDVDHAVKRITLSAAARDDAATLTVTSAALDVSPSGATVVTVTLRGRPTNERLASPWLANVREFDVNLPIGRTRVEATVTAEDARVARTRTITVTRSDAAFDATLSDLVVYVASGLRLVPMVPAFSPSVYAYSVNITADDVAVVAAPTASDSMHRYVRVNTEVIQSGSLSREHVVPPGGTIRINVAVTAQDGTTVAQYDVDVHRAAHAEDASLKSLHVSAGALTPGFSPSVTTYALTLGHAVNAIAVTPVASDPMYDRIIVNGVGQPSGSASRDIEIPEGHGNGEERTLGTTTVLVTCVAQDRATSTTYVVHVTREPTPIAPSDATLRELRVAPTAGTRLVPAFHRETSTYELFAPHSAPSVSLTPITNDVNVYRITVNGDDIERGDAYTTTMDDLLAREDVWIDIKVYAANCDPDWASAPLLVDGYPPTWCSRRTYRVEMLEYGPGAYEGLRHLSSGDQADPGGAIREMRPFPVPFRDSPAFLSSLEWKDEGADDEGYCGNWLCANSVVDATLAGLEVRVSRTNAPLTGDAPNPASAAPNTTISYAPAFHNETKFYVAADIATKTDRISIKATAASNLITNVTINGVGVNSGVFSGDIDLAFGLNVFEIVVTAGHYHIQSTYTLQVSRPVHDNSYLADMVVSHHELFKYEAPNLTDVPKPVAPCDLYDASFRSSSGLAYQPMCDSGVVSAAPSALHYGFELSETSWNLNDDSLQALAEVVDPTADNVDDANHASHAFHFDGFHYHWFDYIIVADTRTDYVIVNASTADANAELITIGQVRNCHAMPRTSGCVGKDFDAWGWVSGDHGFTSVKSERYSPPVDLRYGTTLTTITVTAHDSASKSVYTLRTARMPPKIDAEIRGVGAFLDALISQARQPRTEVTFTFRLGGVDAIWTLDPFLRETIEVQIQNFVRYAAVADVHVFADVSSSNKTRAGDVDAVVKAIFPYPADATTLMTWISQEGWVNTPGFTFDEYLLNFGPISVVQGPTRTTTPSIFAPWRKTYYLDLPAGTNYVPITIPPTESPVDGYAITIDDEPYAPGSTKFVEVVKCAIGPVHCDAQKTTITIDVCVFETCAKYVFVLTSPPSPAPIDDASLRDLNITAGPSDASSRVGVEYTPAFHYAQRTYRAAVDSSLERVYVAAAPNSPRYSGLFVNGRRVAPYASVAVSMTELERDYNGVVTIRVIAEDTKTTFETKIRVFVRSPFGFRAEEANALDELKGKFGDSGGVLPGGRRSKPETSDGQAMPNTLVVGLDVDPPKFAESYPRVEPLWEGGPHLELTARTSEPSVVYYALTVPWARPPTTREVIDAAKQKSDTATRLIAGGNVSGFISTSLAAAAAAGAASPAQTESGFVAAGVMTSAHHMTRERRVFLTCLDPDVGFDAYFVAEDRALDLALNPSPNAQPSPTAVFGARPGGGPNGLAAPWSDALADVAIDPKTFASVIGGGIAAVTAPVGGVATSTRALVFPASPSGAQSLSTAAAVGALPCDAAVRFEVSPLDDAAGAGDLVLETRREPTGGIVTAWREVWRMSMSDLRAASAAASASVGWVSVVAETLDAGEDHVLRWSGPGNATWGLRNVSTRYVVP